MNKVIFWDFHNTLAYKHNFFIDCVIMVLDKYQKGHTVNHESLYPHMQTGFPWLEPDKEYHHLKDPQKWWDNLYPVFINALTSNGIDKDKALLYTKQAHNIMTGPDYYTLFDDTLETLKRAITKGYRNIILSNHIPELPQMAKQLGVMDYIDICISSANIGYEKPNRKIFEYAINVANNPDTVWMVGDSYDADYLGATAAGIKTVLVRNPLDEVDEVTKTEKVTKKVKYYSDDIKGALDIILQQ